METDGNGFDWNYTVLSVSACGGVENTTSNEPQTTANVVESSKNRNKVALWIIPMQNIIKKI